MPTKIYCKENNSYLMMFDYTLKHHIEETDQQLASHLPKNTWEYCFGLGFFVGPGPWSQWLH